MLPATESSRGAGQSRQRPCGVTPAWPLFCGLLRPRVSQNARRRGGGPAWGWRARARSSWIAITAAQAMMVMVAITRTVLTMVPSRQISTPRRQRNHVPARRENYGGGLFAGWAKRKCAHHFEARSVTDGGHVADAPLPTLRFRYSIANALETIATGLLSVAERSVTRPKLMVRPRRTTRASASTSEAETARMKCMVWSTVVRAR